MKYRKKPVVIDAVQWFGHGDHSAVKPYLVDPMALVTCGGCGQDMQIKRSMGGGVGISHATHGLIDTLEGKDLTVCPGDWIIMGVKGEFYACKPDIFAMTYELAHEHAEPQRGGS